MTPEEELKQLGVSCAMNFNKLNDERKRFFLEYLRALKHIERTNDEAKKS